MRASRPLPSLAALAALAGSIALFACGPAKPVSFPDRADVTAAQATWCETLAKVNGKGADWDHMARCKAATPTGSAAYLKLVATCVAERHAEAGPNAPDVGVVAASCGEDMAMKMSADDAAGRGAIEARCRWAERCAKVPAADCKAAVEKLEISQRVVLTSMYNAEALFEVAACLDGAACQQDEDAAYAACYKPVSEKVLWFP